MERALKLTQSIRNVLDCDIRAFFDETHLVMSVYEQHGLSLTVEQKSTAKNLLNPASIVRIANREKKRLLKERKRS